MKKIMMLFLVLIILLSTRNVLAQDQYKLTLEKQEGIYFSRKGVNYQDDSNVYYLYRFGNMYAYCIQPGKHITTYNYLGMDNYVDLPVSDEVKEKLELIGYFGRDYPGHDNIRYSMATQALIWELTGVDTVTFWTEKNEKGKEIDITKERNEIMRLVNNYSLLPNINKNITANLNKEMIFQDSNKTLDNYEIVNDGGNKVSIINNTITIIPKVIGKSTITLKYHKYDDLKTIIFVGKETNDTQVMGRLRFNGSKEVSINLNTKGTKLVLNKVDDEGKRIKIEGIKFKIKNKSNNQYLCENDTCQYQTNSEGIIVTNYLDDGEYEIEEIENNLPEYLYNPDKMLVTINNETILKINDDYNYVEVNFVNKKVKGEVEIYKKGEEVLYQDNEIIYEKINLANIEFDLFNEKDELIKTIKTDDNGHIKVSNLLIGKYYLKEKTNLDNYVINNEKVFFEIKKENNKGSSIRLDINNYLKKGKLEFSKEDLVTSEGIPNTIIEIYNEKDEVILTKETDDNGKIIIDELPLGKYYIIEKEANTNYQITNEKVFFEIKENGEIVKTKMTNEKIVIEVPKTNTKEATIVHSLFIFGILIGLGRFYYERKETT